MCNSEKFKEYNHQGVVIDFCHNCKGLWFDKAELSLYTSTGEDIPELEKVLSSAKKTEMICPRCPEVHLVEMNYHPDEPLLIDYCQNCHGVFLDKKEIVHLQEIAAKHKLTGIKHVLSKLKDDGFMMIA
ncbi:MAG: zf-TFIIB domain-containing protein [Bdellovibrionales bacterium]|nr:zf-TFIIB domain-containing protein [Bdellovibrionales bacterium]